MDRHIDIYTETYIRHTYIHTGTHIHIPKHLYTQTHKTHMCTQRNRHKHTHIGIHTHI